LASANVVSENFRRLAAWQEVPSLTHANVLRHARSIATSWTLEDAWDDVLRISPGFGASIALHGLADILKNWLGGREHDTTQSN